jgi:drug/metabolite transporter (DMT)-like permease
VLIKSSLDEIPPLTFAGLRYTLAFLILLPGLWRHTAAVRMLSRQEWMALAALGFTLYTLTQGGQFLTLFYLDAIPFSLLLNFTTVLVALVGAVLLREVPALRQWVGIALFLSGVLLYFYPSFLPAGQALGLVIGGITVCANAAASLLGRSVNRRSTVSPLVVTVVSMGFGGILLLGIGLAVQGLPALSRASWIVIGWLALVNTALAFTLWNITLRTLTAVESSIINNTMLVQIAVLAWLFLGEQLTALDVAGLALAAVGVLVVQIGGSAQGKSES